MLKNNKPINIKQSKIYLVLSAASIFGSSLTSLCFLTIATSKHGFKGSFTILATFYFAVAVSGLVASLAGRFRGTSSLLGTMEILRALILIFCIFCAVDHLYILAISNFLLALLDGVHHPNAYHWISNTFTAEQDKNQFIVQLQSMNSIGAAIGPIAGGSLILLLGTTTALIIDCITFMATAIYWLSIVKNTAPQYQDKLPLLIGYKTIWSNKKLRYLNACRIFGNGAFLYWNLILPYLLIHFFARQDFAVLQGFSMATMALGIFFINGFGYKIAKSLKISMETLFGFVVIIASSILLVILLYAEQQVSAYLLIVMALLVGIANGSLRTSLITVGLSITPQHLVSIVIAAGDSVVRLLTAVLGLLLGMMMLYVTDVGYRGIITVVCVMATILSAFALKWIKSSQ